MSGNISESMVFEERESAFRKRMFTFAVINLNHIDLKEFLSDAFPYFEKHISDCLNEMHMLKVSTCLSAEFQKSVETENGSSYEKQTIYIQTKGQPITILILI